MKLNLTLGKRLLLNDKITTELKQICLLCALIQLHVQIEGMNIEKVSTEQFWKPQEQYVIIFNSYLCILQVYVDILTFHLI